MKRSLLAATFFLAGAALAQDYKLGATVGDFSVQDLKGAPIAFNQLKSDLTVVIFISTQCPVSNAYNERMKSLYADYTPKGVHFLFVNANSTEPAGEVEKHAQLHAFPFPVYKDAGNVVADRFGTQATPEVYVMDKSGTMRYHGSIDDSQQESRIQNQWLRRALDALIAGQPVEKAETKAFGCSIKRVRKSM
jgi:peroxiredoxin